MESYFSSQFFASNRQNLRELFTGTAPIVITASVLLQKGGDNTYPFTQDASFWYLTGLDEPEVVLVMDKGDEYLILPPKEAHHEIFDGSINKQALSLRSGIKTIYDNEEGWTKLKARLKKVRHVATLANPQITPEVLGFYLNPARDALTTKLKAYNSELKFLDLGSHITRLRMIKGSAELKGITKAIDITAAAISDVTRSLRLNKNQRIYMLEAKLTYGMLKRGASGHAFTPVLASGKEACTLHIKPKPNKLLSKTELLLIDVGAEVEHYAADISRVVSLNNRVTKRQRAVYDAVLAVQDYAISLLKPGLILKNYEEKVEHFMGEKLRELNLIKSINSKNVKQFYPHLTSHSIGLNVHDVIEREKPLQAGVVLTVEPGIYIKEEGLGVRIEDDVLITPSGNKVLSSKLPKNLTLD